MAAKGADRGHLFQNILKSISSEMVFSAFSIRRFFGKIHIGQDSVNGALLLPFRY